jgi:microcystin-dependent protein
MDAYVGSVCAFGFNFTPVNWLPCNGQALQISQYDVLYALIGTTYGGDGVTTFKLPDLRGRVPIHMGQGPGLSNYTLGQVAGAEQVTLTTANLAAHTHGASGATIPVNIASTANTPGGNYFGSNGGYFATTADGTNMMAPASVVSGPAFSGPAPIAVLSPYNTVNYCICCVGLWPTHP